MSLLILVVDDEPDVEALFRQQFRRDIRDGRFTMDFAQSANGALNLISDAACASLIDATPPGSSPQRNTDASPASASSAGTITVPRR